jgi:hypothetical protein
MITELEHCDACGQADFDHRGRCMCCAKQQNLRLKAVAKDLLTDPGEYSLGPLRAFTEELIRQTWWMPAAHTAEVMAEHYEKIADRLEGLSGRVYSAISKTDRFDMARDCLLIAARLFDRQIHEHVEDVDEA